MEFSKTLSKLDEFEGNIENKDRFRYCVTINSSIHDWQYVWSRYTIPLGAEPINTY